MFLLEDTEGISPAEAVSTTGDRLGTLSQKSFRGWNRNGVQIARPTACEGQPGSPISAEIEFAQDSLSRRREVVMGCGTVWEDRLLPLSFSPEDFGNTHTNTQLHILHTGC